MMQTPSSTYAPRQTQAPIATYLEFMALTVGFMIFCAIATITAWYLVGWFQNDSYKAVSFFLVLISVSNVGSKYLIWCVKH